MRGGESKDQVLIESTRHYSDGTETPRSSVVSAKYRIDVASGGGVLAGTNSLDAVLEDGTVAAAAAAVDTTKPPWFNYVDAMAASTVRDALRLGAVHVVSCVLSSYRSDYFETPKCARQPYGSRCELTGPVGRPLWPWSVSYFLCIRHRPVLFALLDASALLHVAGTSFISSRLM